MSEKTKMIVNSSKGAAVVQRSASVTKVSAVIQKLGNQNVFPLDSVAKIWD
jgi:hypothetical protein